VLAGFFYALNLMPRKIAKRIYNGDEWNDDDVMMRNGFLDDDAGVVVLTL
jgi:hypothetical protein